MSGFTIVSIIKPLYEFGQEPVKTRELLHKYMDMVPEHKEQFIWAAKQYVETGELKEGDWIRPGQLELTFL